MVEKEDLSFNCIRLEDAGHVLPVWVFFKIVMQNLIGQILINVTNYLRQTIFIQIYTHVSIRKIMYIEVKILIFTTKYLHEKYQFVQLIWKKKNKLNHGCFHCRCRECVLYGFTMSAVSGTQ